VWACASGAFAQTPPQPSEADLSSEVKVLRTEVAELRQNVASLRQRIEAVERQVSLRSLDADRLQPLLFPPPPSPPFR
jgi:hypothetical protein